MPKFNKTESELVTMFDKWMFVLRNLSRLLERPKALQDRVFKKLFQQAEIAKYDEVERRQYEASLKEYWDYTSTLETAERKGEIRGRAEGRAEGHKAAKYEDALKMKAKGYAVEDIAEITGLTVEEIKEL